MKLLAVGDIFLKSISNKDPLEKHNAVSKPEKTLQIGIIGFLPPPYGGITIHIKRLLKELDKQNIKYHVYPQKIGFRGFLLFEELIKMIKSDTALIHYNSASKCIGFFFIYFLHLIFKRKYIISIHGNDVKWPFLISAVRPPENTFLVRFLYKIIMKILRESEFVICANSLLKELLISRGLDPTKVKNIPSFIPPGKEEISETDVPPHIEMYIKNHNPFLLAYGYNLVFFEGNDLYGLDMCIDLFGELCQPKLYPKMGLVFYLPNETDSEYLKKMEKEIRKKGYSDDFLIVKGGNLFLSLLDRADLLVRPTNTDGDALSIREALSLGIPVVASDCVPRPEGVITFRVRDNEDFLKKVLFTLNNLNDIRQKITEHQSLNNSAAQIIELYRELYQKVREDI